MTKNAPMLDRMTETTIASITKRSAIEYHEMKAASGALLQIVKLVRYALGKEPKGAKLHVSGSFGPDFLDWRITFEYDMQNPAHVEYLHDIGR
jgi:hypothetical protein